MAGHAAKLKCVTDGHLLSSGQEGLVSETLGHRLHSIRNNLGSWLKSLLTELLCCRVSAACCSSCWLQDLMSQVTCHRLSILLNSLRGSKEWFPHNCQPRSWQCLLIWELQLVVVLAAKVASILMYMLATELLKPTHGHCPTA